MGLVLRRGLYRPNAALDVAPTQTLRDATSLEAFLWHFDDDDVSTGTVTTWDAIGWRPQSFTQADSGKRPTKEAGGGVKFTKATSQYLLGDGEPTAILEHRGGYFIARGDMAGNPAAEVTLGTINTADADDTACQPRIYFKAGKMGVQWRESGGPKSIEIDCDTSPDAKNVLVWHRRGGWMHASVNAVRGTPVEFRGATRGDNGSHMGANSSLGMDFWVHKWGMLQSEFSDDVFARLEGLAMRAAERQADLVSLSHPYATTHPTLTDADFDSRYEHDATAWTDYQNYPGGQGNNDTAHGDPSLVGTRMEHRTEAMPDLAGLGYVKVFEEHFKGASSPLVDPKIGDPTASLFACYEIGPGNSVNIEASVGTLGGPTYVFDGTGDGTMTLRMLNGGAQWDSGLFATTNNEGQGRWWKPPFVWEIRCKFVMPGTGEAGGLFPAPIWGYNRGKYTGFRTRSTIEVDGMELDGISGTFVNVTHHVHNPDAISDFNTAFPDAARLTDTFEKLAGYHVNTAKFGADLEWFDGGYQRYFLRVDEDFTYGYMEFGAQTYELFRGPTYEGLVGEYLNIIVDWALKGDDIVPAIDPAEDYDMVVDYLRVWKPTDSLDDVPAAGFSARPTIAGTAEVGETLTLTTNAVSTITGQLQIRWYLTDGSPIVGESDTTLVIPAAAEGFGVRAHVINLGVKDKPEAWTADTATITAVTPWTFAEVQANIIRDIDVADATKTTVVSGLVTEIVDKSTSAVVYSQATSAKQPAYSATMINGNPGWSGDGTADIALTGSPLSFQFLVSYVATNMLQMQVNAVAALTTSSAVDITQPIVYCFAWSPTGAVARINGVQVNSDSLTTRTTTGCIIGVVDVDGAGGGGGGGGRIIESAAGSGNSVIGNRTSATGRQFQGKSGRFVILDTNDADIVNFGEGRIAYDNGVTLDASHPWSGVEPTF